jgi:predicted enzyme related to lactoylglutathione lyase
MDLLTRIAWWELVGRDLAAAQRQYAALGWQQRELGLRQRYPLWTQAGQGRAGWAMLPKEALDAGAVPHWMPCAVSQDLTAVLGRVARLAGQVVVEPCQVPHLGVVATLVDPQGAALTLLQPTARMRRFLLPPASPPPVLWAADPAALAPFYAQLLGWQVLSEVGKGLLLGGQGVACAELAPRPAGAPPLWLPRWPVRDGENLVNRWQSAGGRCEGAVLLDGEALASLPEHAPAPQ